MVIGLILLAIVVVLGFLFIGAYNRLVALRQNVGEAFADIDVQLKQRQDLIPNLVETVKGYAAHERDTLDEVTQARAAAASAGNVEARAQAETALTGALGRLMAVAEAYPELKANQNFMQLQGELADLENKIAAARRFFNNAVGEYNASIQRFPAVLIAGAAGFQPREFFDVGADRAALQSAPQVKFSWGMRALGLQTYIWNNNIRSVLLLIGFPFLLLGMVFCLTLGMIWARMLPAGYEYGGAVPYALRLMAAAAPLAIVVALVWFAIAYVFNQAIIDFATGSRPVTREEQPVAWNLLENLCISRGLRMPTLRLIETNGMNAFASGLHEGRFSVTVTRGLLQNLDRNELEAVLGHELTHIINRDVRTMVVAAIFAGVITLFCQIVYRSIVWGGVWGGGGRDRRGNFGLFLLVAMVVGAVGYFLAIVIRMAISRTREYVADAGSVELTHNPDAMISALQKVAGHTHLDAPASMRAMFLEDDDEGIMGLFATHPPVAKRIAALSQYAGGRVNEPRPTAAPITPTQTESPSEEPGPWGGREDGPPGPWS